MVWNSSRPTGYGGVPEYRPVALADNGELASSSAWRGRWADLSGLYCLGARYYDPVAGSFISCDPLGHDSDPSLYTFAGGDPINLFDPDGRFGKQVGNESYRQGRAVLGFGLDAVNDVVYGSIGMGSETVGVGFDMVRTSTGLPISTGDWFRNQANTMETWLSPYAKAGWYDPRHPLAQAGTAYLIVVQPETFAGKMPATGSILARETATLERVAIADGRAAATDARVANVMDDGIPPGMMRQPVQQWQAQTAKNPIRPASGANYSVVKEAKLRPWTFTASDANHFRQANRQLYEMMQADPALAARLEADYPGITAHVTPGPRGGFADTSPPGLTWHHDPQMPGNLQLVPRNQHQSPGPVQDTLHPGQQGGRDIWGGGR